MLDTGSEQLDEMFETFFGKGFSGKREKDEDLTEEQKLGKKLL